MKTFLLGVGCAKGGTTWMHNYLHNHRSVDMGITKEYHIFDHLHTKWCPAGKSHLRRVLSSEKNCLLKGVYGNIDKYYEYFDDLFGKKKDTVLVGDITPVYALIPVDVFKNIKLKLESKGFRVKVVFLMRDPVERCWSNLRMTNKKYKNRSTTDRALLSDCEKTFTIEKTKYEKTIKKLEQVFDKEDIHYAFYETLFNESSIEELTDFLSIPHVSPSFDKKLNASPKNTSMEESTLSQIANQFEQTYRFVFEKFGEEKIRNIWANSRYIN